MDSPAANFARDRGWSVGTCVIDGETRYVLMHDSSPKHTTSYKTEEAAWGMAAIRAGWTTFAQERAKASTRLPTRGNPRGYGRPAR